MTYKDFEREVSSHNLEIHTNINIYKPDTIGTIRIYKKIQYGSASSTIDLFNIHGVHLSEDSDFEDVHKVFLESLEFLGIK